VIDYVIVQCHIQLLLFSLGSDIDDAIAKPVIAARRPFDNAIFVLLGRFLVRRWSRTSLGWCHCSELPAFGSGGRSRVEKAQVEMSLI
jgi:hypothetical protein